MMKWLCLTLLLNIGMLAQESKQNSKTVPLTNFEKVLKKDNLLEKRKEIIQVKQEVKEEINKIEAKKNIFPAKDDFFNFFSEYYLAHNAVKLNWDSEKPDYGIEGIFNSVLRKLGIIGIRYKILVINSPNVPHFYLPSKKDEYLFILSLPFIRSMDLTKIEISILLLEDMFRKDLGQFYQNITLKKSLESLYSSHIDTKEREKAVASVLMKLLSDYDRILYIDGYSFQQQFEVTTKKMDLILRPHPELWSSYIKLLNKIDELVKSDKLYANYNKIYPSPELQIKWLTPKTKTFR